MNKGLESLPGCRKQLIVPHQPHNHNLAVCTHQIVACGIRVESEYIILLQFSEDLSRRYSGKLLEQLVNTKYNFYLTARVIIDELRQKNLSLSLLLARSLAIPPPPPLSLPIPFPSPSRFKLHVHTCILAYNNMDKPL
jgi:hypothetical protein